jgi:hypothetical protein
MLGVEVGRAWARARSLGYGYLLNKTQSLSPRMN